MAETAIATTIYNVFQAVALKVTGSAVIAYNVGQAAVTASIWAAKVAVLAGINAVVANQNKPRDQGGLINLTISPNEPRRLQIGKRMNGGVLVDWYVTGSKNKNLFLVIYLGEGPMGALSRVLAGGREVYGSPIAHGVRTTIPDFRSGGDRLWITYYDGRPGQTADATLAGAGVGWSSNHIGTGCAYVIVECLWDSDNLRSPPQLGFELEGAKFYDRRLDTTAGGSGSHRIDNPATWALSNNPAVALDHYLLGRYAGSVKTFGVGIDAQDVPYARFAALANLCDEAVDLKAGGTQDRYQANGFLFADRSYADTIKDLCRAMNARPADFGGRIGVIDSEERTPVLTLTDGDVIESATEQYSPKRSWGEMVSVVRGTFQDPLQNYQASEYPRVTDDDWVTEDGGSPKEATLDLEMETNAERAQRLAYLYAVRERRQAQLTGTYGLRAIELEQGDWFIRSGGIFGAGKTFEVIDRALNVSNLTVTLTAFEVDPADSAWDETTAADPLPAPVSSDDLLQDMAVPSLTVTGITLTGTAAQLPAIQVEWTAPDDPRVLQILIEAVPTAGGVPTSAIVDVGTGEVTFTSGITDDTDYLVRARFIGTFSPSDWTSNFAVTTLGDYSVGEASSVPWSGLTGDIPDGVDNGNVGAGGNSLLDTGFRKGTEFWTIADNSSGSLSFSTLEYASGIRIAQAVASGFTAGEYLMILTQATNRIPVKAGDRVGVRALLGGVLLSSLNMRIAWLNDAGGVDGYSSMTPRTSGILTGAGEKDFFTEETVVGVAPSGATKARLDVFGYCTGAAPRVRLAIPTMAVLAPDQLVAPPLSLGFDGAPGADPTIDNTAAAITGQGSQAIANHQRGSTYSGTPTEGSWWSDTSTSQLKLYTGGAWQIVATIGNQNITITRTNGFVKTRIGNGTNTTNSVSFSASGGSGAGYTFAHELFVTYTSGPSASLSSSSGTPITASATGVVGDEVRGFVQTVCTDSASNTSTLISPLALFWEI
jgi:hypothetical protein